MTSLAIPVLIASIGLFVVAATYTRARSRRVVAALLAGIGAAALNIGWDLLAARMNWWRYSEGAADHAPWIMYIPVALWFGGGIGLIGWRMTRTWGGRGALAFLGAFTLVGYVRDRTYDARADVFHFGPGLAPHLADALAWLSLALLVQVVMRALAGAAHADELR